MQQQDLSLSCNQVVITKPRYSMKLQNGRGLIDETRTLVELWYPGMSSVDLRRTALDSGRFANISARRLRNIVNDAFAPRYLTQAGRPAQYFKILITHLTIQELTQFIFLYTCRANPILRDFIRDVYWDRYASGSPTVTTADAALFVRNLVSQKLTYTPWAESTITRAASDLIACCAEFGLLEKSGRSKKNIRTFHVSSKLVAFLAYDLHFSGSGDNAVVAHEDWKLLGLSEHDLVAELKKLSLMGFLIFQSAANFFRITWRFTTMEEVCDALIKSGF